MKKSPEPQNPCARGSEPSYLERSNNLHNRASAAYREWVANMSAEERAKLQDLGLENPSEDESEVGGHSPYSLSDIADTPIARTDTDYAAVIDQPHELLADEFGLTTDQARRMLKWHQQETASAVERKKAHYLQLIIGGLLSAKNPKINAAGLAFATNLSALNGLPCQREYARQNNISPSAVSKVVKGWSRTLGLRPSAHQKSEQACSTYSQVGKAQHWRDRPLTVGAATQLLRRMRPPSNPSMN